MGGNGKIYSEADLNKIAASIVAGSQSGNGSSENTVYLSGKSVKDDWSDEGFIREMYDNNYLAAVQQGYRTETITFEQYLQESLAQLENRRSELTQEVLTGNIDQRTYGNAKMVAELATEAIKKFLEKTEKQRLTGV